MKCPECGEELQPGVRVCPNCEYELSDAEMAQNGAAAPAAPERPAAQAPQKPAVSAPERPAGYKPQKPAQPEVAMPESIMAHGDVSVASNQQDDHSVHQTQNTTNNTQNNTTNHTTNNTQQTIIINVGAGGQLPGGIVDEQTRRAVNEVAQQQAEAQAQQQRQRPQQPKPQKPQQQAQQEEPTFSDRKPQKDEKGVGSIAGQGTITVQTGRKMPGWVIAVIIVVVIGVAGALVFGGGKKASPEPEGQKAETVSNTPAKTTTTPAKPAKTQTTPSAQTTPTTQTTSASPTSPATTTSRAVAPAQADPYQEGMNAYNSGDYGRAVEQLSKASASAEKKKAADAAYKLGLMYETGDGVAADKQQAIEWYQKAAKLGSKEAKRKLM